MRVDVDAKLQNRFKGYLKQQLQGKDFHIAEYDFNNADGDDTLFTISADATDFPKVESQIDGVSTIIVRPSTRNCSIQWAYVVLFENDKRASLRLAKNKFDDQPKKVVRLQQLFQDHKLVDVDDQQVFMIDPRFDFLFMTRWFSSPTSGNSKAP